MKIILVIPTLKQGGAERVISELANFWSGHNHEIHLMLLAKGKHFYKVNKKVSLHEFEFEKKGILLKIIDELKIFFQLRKFLAQTKPVFVLSFMTKYNIFTILASLFLSTCVFVSDRGNPKEKLPFTISILRKITYRWATGIIAQTSLAKTILGKQTGNRNIQIIPNPLREVKVFPDVRKEKIVLCIGRLVSEKGQKYLMESFAKLNHKDWNLVFLGDGPLKNDLKKQALELGLTDQLIMPGEVGNIDAWLAKASIFAFPSVSEGFPNALVEAMAAGLPCVSFDCDAGPGDIIINEINGLLVEVYNVDNFAEKLEILINNIELRNSLGDEAKKIKKNLEISVIANKILNFCSSQPTTHAIRNSAKT